MIRLDLGPLVGVLTDPTGLEQTGEVLVGRRDGDQVRFLFPWPHDDRLSIPLAEAPSMVKAIDGQQGFERARFGSHDVLIAYRAVDYQRNYGRWGMIAKIDAYEAYTPLRRVRRTISALGMALLCAGPGRCLRAGRSLRTPHHAPGRLRHRSGPRRFHRPRTGQFPR